MHTLTNKVIVRRFFPTRSMNRRSATPRRRCTIAIVVHNLIELLGEPSNMEQYSRTVALKPISQPIAPPVRRNTCSGTRPEYGQAGVPPAKHEPHLPLSNGEVENLSCQVNRLGRRN